MAYLWALLRPCGAEVSHLARPEGGPDLRLGWSGTGHSLIARPEGDGPLHPEPSRGLAFGSDPLENGVGTRASSQEPVCQYKPRKGRTQVGRIVPGGSGYGYAFGTLGCNDLAPAEGCDMHVRGEGPGAHTR